MYLDVRYRDQSAHHCTVQYRFRVAQTSLLLKFFDHFQDQWKIQLISNPLAPDVWLFIVLFITCVLWRQCSSGAGISSTSELSMHLGSQVSRWENRGEKRELITISCPGRQSALAAGTTDGCHSLGQLQISVFVVVLMIIPQLT